MPHGGAVFGGSAGDAVLLFAPPSRSRKRETATASGALARNAPGVNGKQVKHLRCPRNGKRVVAFEATRVCHMPLGFRAWEGGTRANSRARRPAWFGQLW
jgi:hypothetical protein